MRYDVIPWSVAVARGVPSAGRRVRARRGACVRITAPDGAEGWGEASPLPGTSPDRLPDVLAELRALHPREIARALDDVEAIASAPPGALAAALASVLDRLALRAPSARFGVESALLDVIARRRGVPLHRELAPVGTFSAQAIAALVDAADPADAARQGRALCAAGYRTLKLKAGVRFDDGLACVRAVRDAVGVDVAIRVDANGAWDRRDVPERLALLAAMEVELVEEPGSLAQAPARMEDHAGAGAGAGARSPCVALDESLVRPEVLDILPELLACGACRAVVLKPTLLGGAASCIALAVLAARHDAAIVVTHAFGGPIELAACAELALALSALLPGARLLAHGLAPHAVVRATGAIPPQLRGARIVPVAGPGIGIARTPSVVAAGAP